MTVRVLLLRIVKLFAAISGVLIGATGAVLLLLTLEGLRARESIGARLSDFIPKDSGTSGGEFDADALHLVMMGDSLAVGVGAEDASETVGSTVARGLASRARRPVEVHNVAVSGSDSRDLATQMAAMRQGVERPDVAVVITGSNDVMHRIPVGESVRHLYRTVIDLRRMGCWVVVATCPDLGTVRPLFQPLRFLVRRASRKLAVAQTIVVLRAGGRAVPLGATLGPIFWRKPKIMFSSDNFHPSALGYARAAALILPSVQAAADHWNRRGFSRTGTGG